MKIRPFKKFKTEIVEVYDPVLEMLVEKNIADMSPEQHKLHRQNEAEATQWHAAHPVSHENVINHYNQATHDEKSVGHSWYADAHHMAKMVSHDTKTPMHTVAGLISNYSPQTHWHTNILTAARVAKTKHALGGTGSGVMATEGQKHSAQRMLNGEHYDHVITGHKTHAFAHLIEHGGNADNSNPKVVIDRHAHSVASGARMTDAAFGQVKLKSKKGYGHVADAYHKAAAHLSEQHGQTIHPHQVQATTWLVRQRLNSAEDSKYRAAKNAGTAKKKWDSYASEHHPSLVGKEPGTGHG